LLVLPQVNFGGLVEILVSSPVVLLAQA